MQALVTRPGVPHSAHVADIPAAAAGPGEVLLRVLEVGVCGTDREIVHGLFGVPPEGGGSLVLGHELLAVVENDGCGFTRGDLVTATVRRSCSHCIACAEGAPDSCLTGDYSERGITRLDGFARELVAEDAEQLVAIPRSLGRSGVLAEPTSICARALRHVRAIGDRQPWRLQRALVLGRRLGGHAVDAALAPGGRRGLGGLARAGGRSSRRADRELRRALRVHRDVGSHSRCATRPEASTS